MLISFLLQVEKELEDHLEEFFLVGDTSELVACLQEMVPRLPVGRTESLGLSLLRVALPKACDARTEGPRDRVCEMLAPLHTANLLVGHELQALFRDTLEFMEDEVYLPALPSPYSHSHLAWTLIGLRLNRLSTCHISPSTTRVSWPTQSPLPWCLSRPSSLPWIR